MSLVTLDPDHTLEGNKTTMSYQFVENQKTKRLFVLSCERVCYQGVTWAETMVWRVRQGDKIGSSSIE